MSHFNLADIPARTQVLVVGGGPAGSYAASALAREGIDVVLLDMSKFPRYHIGESLLPSVRHFLRFIDAEHKVAEYGFARKPGSAIKFNQYMREGYTDFVALGAENNAWNVRRSEFDNLLLEHSADSGAKVFTQTRVDSLEFLSPESTPTAASSDIPTTPESARSFWGFGDSRSRSSSVQSHTAGYGGAGVGFGGMNELGRPYKAFYAKSDGKKGEIEFDYLVDASGRNGLLSTRYLKNRQYNQSLKNVAVWGYWRGTGMYGKGTPRENAPFFEALSDESGWAWFIPLHNGMTSVGIVMDQKQLGIRSRAASSATTAPLPPSFSASSTSFSHNNQSKHHVTLADKYLMFLHLAPGVQALMGDNAELVEVCDENGESPAARSASDFSYSAESYAGVGWRIAGDAGAFIDPFFSSGVHLAMTGGLSAAATIAASLRGDCEEKEAATYHSKRVAISYTRFLVVVLSAYKQIRSQSENILADIDEDNFDKAFEFFRPVIQGGADMGKTLSEDEVQRALDFCINIFSPTTPEQHESVQRKILESQWWVPDEHDENKGDDKDGEHKDEDKGKDEDSTHCQSTESKSHPAHDADASFSAAAKTAASRLMDVRSPIIDPSALTRLLKSRLSIFTRANSSESVKSVKSIMSDSSASSSKSTPPESPVSAVFSVASASSASLCSQWGGESVGVVGSEKLGQGGEESDSEVKMVLEKVNARRVIHADMSTGVHSLEQEAVDGMLIRLKRGELGLVRVD
ncbi:hypothetical protein BDY19DRAFT_991965 [Irpex rosettiformis]|uniref:Uncharacterized protein n=1 Tax=Irpex rosettiformis TaxID=378272 RepID=A0ACB8U979_9APHY|nr:hypothetical protein BDY19DRAFT_991965 [Irpex rosettiformis]